MTLSSKAVTSILMNMMLPELPKQNKKLEAKFGIRLKKWLEQNPCSSCSIENKHTSGTSIPFSVVEEKQINYALAISGDRGTLIRVEGRAGEPDYIWARRMPAFIVIKYPKEFSMISIDNFLFEKKRSTRKSLTMQRAREISTITVKL